MVSKIYIKNFKAFEDSCFDFSSVNLLIGENDSGKSSILQALDLFFNQDSVDKFFVRDIEKNVEISVVFDDGKFQNKIFKAKTFKFDEKSSNYDETYLSSYKYLFLQANQLDVKKTIIELASSKISIKVSDDIKESILDTFQECINEVLLSANRDLFVVDDGKIDIKGEVKLNLESAAKFSVTSTNVPLEGHGSGYQKNLLYSLLVGDSYKNVLLGIDEIENSFSLNNVNSLIGVLKRNFKQLVITTHSSSVVNLFNLSDIIPLARGWKIDLTTVIELLGGLGKDKFVVVEGKTDVLWVTQALFLLGKKEEFIVIQGGGAGNVDYLCEELSSSGKTVFKIKDGDKGETGHCLSKETIELYIPLDFYRDILDPEADCVPNTSQHLKDEYFRIKGHNLGSCFKDEIAERVSEFLTLDSDFVLEIKHLLGV